MYPCFQCLTWGDLLGVVQSLALAQTWNLLPIFPSCYLNPPAWTISTLFCFYLIFPRALMKIQAMKTPQVSWLIGILFHGQLLAGMAVTLIGRWIESRLVETFEVPEQIDVFYWITTGLPYIRWPVFVMGIAAGVLCNRIREGEILAYQGKHQNGISIPFHPWNVKKPYMELCEISNI